MSDYLKAYSKRLERNEADLINLIKAVQQQDNTIEAYINDARNGRIRNVVFFKDDKINSIWFHEVPYRWSGCGYNEHHKSHPGLENCKMPFTAQDVIDTFQPIQTSSYIKRATKEAYLKWYSYEIEEDRVIRVIQLKPESFNLREDELDNLKISIAKQLAYRDFSEDIEIGAASPNEDDFSAKITIHDNT